MKTAKSKIKKMQANRSKRRRAGMVLLVAVVAAMGIILLRQGSAATYLAKVEAETGMAAGTAAAMTGLAGASEGGAVRFGHSDATPAYSQQVVLSGKQNIWDVAPLPSGSLLYVERANKVNIFRNGSSTVIGSMPDAHVQNLGGLLGLTIDPQYPANNYIYICMNTVNDVRVIRWRLVNETSLMDRRDIVTGIPAIGQAYHSGCRIAFGADGNLWVATGDATIFGNAQNTATLGGKLLRVTRDGTAVAGNQGGSFDPRVFNYGHRNMQGLAMFGAPKNGVYGLSTEHGADDNDEVNELRNGNFGWDPVADGSKKYQEIEINTPMTDLQKFPDAIRPIWTSGTSETQAPSGATIIYGYKWKGWDGAAAVAMLKGKHLKILRLDAANKVTREEKVLSGTYGRLRTAVMGADGNLYLSTDNGSDDKIIRLTPQ